MLILAAGIVALVIGLPFTIFYHLTGPVPDFGGSYTEGVLGEPKYINPLLIQTNDADRDLSRIIYSSLLKYDQNGQLTADLAESYELSSDGLEYTFTLRKNAQWHDGIPLTADDVVFTIKMLQNNNYNSSQEINWQGVDVEAVNELTVRIKLKNKYAQFLNNATLGILPKHLWENIGPANFPLSDLNLRPIGSGPYKFKKLRKNADGQIESYELEAFQNYHHGTPYIKNLTFRFYSSEEKLVSAYNSNEIDGLGFVSPESIKKLHFPQRLSLQSLKMPRYFAVFFNQNQSKLLSDKNIRLVLNYGTNKQELIGAILDSHGLAVNSPLLKEFTDPQALSKYGYDQAFAKEILANGNWSDEDGDGYLEKKGEKLTVKIKTSDWPELVTAAKILEKQWAALGFKIELQTENLLTIQQSIKDRNYEALLFGEMINPDPDFYSFWHSSQKKDPGLNLALYDNANADKILEEARQTLNLLERSEKYGNFEKILMEDAPAVFLYSPFYLYLPSKKVMGNRLNILPLPSSRFDTVNQWYIKTKRVKNQESSS